MQFLLTAVNAKYIHSNPAIYSLRAYAGEELQPCIALAEYTINQRPEDILEDLYKRQPEVIGFSCYIWNWRLITELLAELPKILPHTDLWLGGPEVSFESEKLLQEYPMVKGIMAGEGEETFRELLAFYAQRAPRARAEEKNALCPTVQGSTEKLAAIRGLVLREGSAHERAPVDLNRIPFLYTCGAEGHTLQEFENRILYYETGRGCPFRCSYCLSSVDKKVRLKNLETVKKELQFFLDHKVHQVKLIDRTFNCNHDHAMAVWQYIKDHDNGVTNFHFEIAADLLREDELALLNSMRPGLVQLEIGVQSVNPGTLKEINRPGNLELLQRNVKILREGHKVHIHLDLIAGLPFEDYESFKNSFNVVYMMKPHQLQLGFLKVLKGTQIREKAESYGLVYQNNPPYEVLYTKWISYEEIRRLKGIEEMVELYYNSGQFTAVLPALGQDFSDPFTFFEKLADYYEEKGYTTASPARSRRYQILLEFAAGERPEKEEAYRELLTFDYYRRENAKSRPDFCRDNSGWREKIWDFYQQEEKKPQFLKEYREFHARQTMKMTHVEVFFYPVWENEKRDDLQRRREPQFVLFDYRKRDAVTGNASVTLIPRR